VTILAVVTQCFTPPVDGRPFTYVFDFSGSHSLTDIHEIQISHTFTIALNLAREGARRQLKAYVRITPSFYDHRDEREKFTEQDLRGWVPLDVRGIWFHEAIRAIGLLPGLPLVILRHGRLHGPGMVDSECGSRYLFLRQFNAFTAGLQALPQSSLERCTKRPNDS
jgi:hypothetical protein